MVEKIIALTTAIIQLATGIILLVKAFKDKRD